MAAPARTRAWLIALLLMAPLAGFTTPVAAQAPDFTALVEHYSAAVVSVNAEGPAGGDETPPDYFRHFFDHPPGTPGIPRLPGPGQGPDQMPGPDQAPTMSLGSGFI